MLPSLGMLVASFTHRGARARRAARRPRRVPRRPHHRDPAALSRGRTGSARDRYREGDVEVDLRGLDLHTDDNGLPIHGSMLARPEWEVTRLGAGPRSARLAARFDFGAHDDLHGRVPVPARARGGRHARRVGPADRHDGATERSGERAGRVRLAPVPAAAGRDRATTWELVAARARARGARRARHPDRPRPSGRRRRPRRSRAATSTTSSRSARTGSSRWPAGDGGSRITYDDGYPYAQVYSPAGDVVLRDRADDRADERARHRRSPVGPPGRDVLRRVHARRRCPRGASSHRFRLPSTRPPDVEGWVGSPRIARGEP